MKNLCLIGGAGALGRAVTKVFRNSWNVTNIDLNSNEEASVNIQYNPDKPEEILDQCSQQFDSIVNVAGGFDMCTIKDQVLFQQFERLQKQNVVSALLAAHLATHKLNERGLVVFTGAYSPFIEPTPEMLAYGLSKVGVHNIAINLANSKELPQNSQVITILPETIDTKANREAMANANFDKWAKPEQIGGLIKMWADGDNRPQNQSFIHLKVENKSVYPVNLIKNI